MPFILSQSFSDTDVEQKALQIFVYSRSISPSSGPWSLGFDLNFRCILVYSPGYSESISPSSDYLDYDSYDSAPYDDDYDKK